MISVANRITFSPKDKMSFRTTLQVPRPREGKAVGALGLWRREVERVLKATALSKPSLTSVIAIENVRRSRN